MSRATDGFSAMTSVFTRRRVAKRANATLSGEEILRGGEIAGLSADRAPDRGPDAPSLPLSEQRGRKPAGGRRLRVVGESHVQSGSLAARDSALPRAAGGFLGPSANLKAAPDMG